MSKKQFRKGYQRHQQDKQREEAQQTLAEWRKGDKSMRNVAADMNKLAKERDHFKACWEAEKKVSRAAWDQQRHLLNTRRLAALRGLMVGFVGGGAIVGVLVAWLSGIL